ncbi:MAG: aconitate hydratase AcnA, partial [Alphaproteobacteria bacterium]
EMLRKKGVVGKFVEFFGPGVGELPLADRATIANMAPEYGATCGLFPIDGKTTDYLAFTGRDEARVALVEAYARAQEMWRTDDAPEPVYTDTLELDLATVEPSLAGPKRPQDRVRLSAAAEGFARTLDDAVGGDKKKAATRVAVEGGGYEIGNGDIVIAAITSCTNTSNPSVMVGAGLVARKAAAKGLKVKPWVKTSLAPGSQVVTDYLEKAGLQDDLDKLGFNLVGYGCTTCIGNSGPLAPPVEAAIESGDLVVCSVLSGNRNFEGRISPHVRANYLASPPLVVAYALAGSMHVDLQNDPLGEGADGKPVYLKDIWPSNHEIHETVQAALSRDMYETRYANVFTGDEVWRGIETTNAKNYDWDANSTYVQQPPYFESMSIDPDSPEDIVDARPLAILGDSVTTDHISPAGAIKADSPAGAYLTDHGVAPHDFNSYGSRRGNHEVMMRGTFANIRLRNEMAPGTSGGITRHMPDGAQMPIYDAAMAYQDAGTPLVVVAGKEYGTGS